MRLSISNQIAFDLDILQAADLPVFFILLFLVTAKQIANAEYPGCSNQPVSYVVLGTRYLRLGLWDLEREFLISLFLVARLCSSLRDNYCLCLNLLVSGLRMYILCSHRGRAAGVANELQSPHILHQPRCRSGVSLRSRPWLSVLARYTSTVH